MPASRVAAATFLAGALCCGPVLAQSDPDAEPSARLVLELQLPGDRSHLPVVNLLLGSKDQSVAMPLTGPLAGPPAGTALNQLEGPDGFFASDMGKWVWWGVSGVAVIAVVASQSGSDDDPAPTGTGAGP